MAPSAKPAAPKIKVIADHREIPSGVPALLQDDPDVELVIENNLELGDYVLNSDLVLERKSAVDFINSITGADRRLFNQAKSLRDSGKRSVLLLQGDPLAVGRLHPHAVIGALSYLSVIEGITVLSVGNSTTLVAQVIKTCARHAQQGLGYEINLSGPKPKTREEQILNVLCALPGVGIAKARALLEGFGSLERILGAPEADVAQVVGPATASKIRLLLS